MGKKLMVCITIIIVIGIIVLILVKGKDVKKTNNELNGALSNENNQKEQIDNITNKDSKILVLYFSATGTTAKVAENIAEITDGNLIEIVPKEEYTESDLSYNNDNCRANKEQNDDSVRPEILNDIDIKEYDIIYLGYPIWWGDVPKIILTLLDKYDFDNKTLIPFCTSGSSGISQSMNTLKSYNKNVNWIEGKRFGASDSKENVKAWIDSLEIIDNNEKKGESGKMYIKIKDTVLTATLEDNLSVKALLERLEENDITIQMSDYSNFEKVGDLGFSLPKNDKQISTDYGDLILYQGNSFVIYYDKNDWNFTKLGHIDDITQEKLKELLGKNDVTVTLSLNRDF